MTREITIELLPDWSNYWGSCREKDDRRAYTCVTNIIGAVVESCSSHIVLFGAHVSWHDEIIAAATDLEEAKVGQSLPLPEWFPNSSAEGLEAVLSRDRDENLLEWVSGCLNNQ